MHLTRTPSVGSKGDSCQNALAKTISELYKAAAKLSPQPDVLRGWRVAQNLPILVVPTHRSRQGLAKLSLLVPMNHYRKKQMNTAKIVAIVLIAGGVLALLYGGFSYTKDTTAVKLGPIELSVKEKETVNVPVWAGVAATVAGGLLLVFGSKKS